jgi:hypothetical protein
MLVVGGLAAGWYLLGHAVPLAVAAVGGEQVQVGSGQGGTVEFRAPDGWKRTGTGDPMLGRLFNADGELLLVRVTTAVTDFDGAAPRRLRELRAMGVDQADYTEALHTSSFSGRLCRARVGKKEGTCAFVVHDRLGVTVLALPGRDGAQVDVPALVDGMRGM